MKEPTTPRRSARLAAKPADEVPSTPVRTRRDSTSSSSMNVEDNELGRKPRNASKNATPSPRSTPVKPSTPSQRTLRTRSKNAFNESNTASQKTPAVSLPTVFEFSDGDDDDYKPAHKNKKTPPQKSPVKATSPPKVSQQSNDSDDVSSKQSPVNKLLPQVIELSDTDDDTLIRKPRQKAKTATPSPRSTPVKSSTSSQRVLRSRSKSNGVFGESKTVSPKTSTANPPEAFESADADDVNVINTKKTPSPQKSPIKVLSPSKVASSSDDVSDDKPLQQAMEYSESNHDVPQNTSPSKVASLDESVAFSPKKIPLKTVESSDSGDEVSKNQSLTSPVKPSTPKRTLLFDATNKPESPKKIHVSLSKVIESSDSEDDEKNRKSQQVVKTTTPSPKTTPVKPSTPLQRTLRSHSKNVVVFEDTEMGSPETPAVSPPKAFEFSVVDDVEMDDAKKTLSPLKSTAAVLSPSQMPQQPHNPDAVSPKKSPVKKATTEATESSGTDDADMDETKETPSSQKSPVKASSPSKMSLRSNNSGAVSTEHSPAKQSLPQTTEPSDTNPADVRISSPQKSPVKLPSPSKATQQSGFVDTPVAVSPKKSPVKKGISNSPNSLNIGNEITEKRVSTSPTKPSTPKRTLLSDSDDAMLVDKPESQDARNVTLPKVIESSDSEDNEVVQKSPQAAKIATPSPKKSPVKPPSSSKPTRRSASGLVDSVAESASPKASVNKTTPNSIKLVNVDEVIQKPQQSAKKTRLSGRANFWIQNTINDSQVDIEPMEIDTSFRNASFVENRSAKKHKNDESFGKSPALANSVPSTKRAIEKSLSSSLPIAKTSTPAAAAAELLVEYIPVENAAKFFKKRGKNSAKMVENLSQSYAAINSLRLGGSGLADELIVKENDDELIWQQICMQNKITSKEIRKTLKLFGNDLRIPEEQSVESESENEEEEEDDEVEDEDAEMESEDEPKAKKKRDLFSLRESDLKNLDAKLRALDDDEDDEEQEELMEDEDDEEEDEAAPAVSKAKPKKSAVDDKFFSYHEMEKFLNEEEKTGDSSDDADVEDDDDEDAETDYHYKDFFEESAPKKNGHKKVHFQEPENAAEENGDLEEMEEDEYEDEAEEETAPVLLGNKKEVQKPSTSHEVSREKMMKVIDKIQSENLNPRSWELSGEIKGDDREVNSLLEKYVEADFRKKQPPINGKEKSDKIHSICLRRFKEKLFDDVVRKYREDDDVQPYRNLTVDMNERKTLMDVYEDKFQSAQNGEAGDNEDVDPQVKDIQKQMNEVFYKLDSLSHFQFAPSRVTEEIRIVKNMPSMRAEEVGPMAAAGANENLLAPEEVSRHAKAAPKAKEERTSTDKKRERRKKKKKQHDKSLLEH